MRVGSIRVTHPCAGRHLLKQASKMLPLDLHVLGLSLAFILSQDQTLRCIISFFYNSIENFAFSPSKGAARDSPVLTLTFFYSSRTTLSIILSKIFRSFLTASLAVRIGYSRKASAKIEPFFFPTKYFCYFFSSFFCSNLQQPNNHFIISQVFFALYSFFLAGIANIPLKSPPRKFIPMFLNIAL